MTGPVILADVPPARPVPVPSGGASRLVTGRGALLAGWSLRETTGTAAAVVNIVTGTSGGGATVATIALAAGVSDTQAMPFPGVWCDSGVWLQVVSGSVTGAVWVADIPT